MSAPTRNRVCYAAEALPELPIIVRTVEDYDAAVFEDLVRRNLESNGMSIRARDFKGPGDGTFEQTGLAVRIGAFDGETLVGLSWGQAVSKSRFIMHISLVEEPYRGRGVYSRMLSLMLEETADFDEVDSCHHIFNNRIIATKLKRDFHIIGIENSITVGPRLMLRYFHNKKLLQLMKFRVGLTPDPRSQSS